jgi:hypothetical protein
MTKTTSRINKVYGSETLIDIDSMTEDMAYALMSIIDEAVDWSAIVPAGRAQLSLFRALLEEADD